MTLAKTWINLENIVLNERSRNRRPDLALSYLYKNANIFIIILILSIINYIIMISII